MYREGMRRCPACGDPMQEVVLTLEDGSETKVDLCGSCGGVFLEFFDGEPVALSRELRHHIARTAWAKPLPSDVPITCPDCTVVMEARPYLDRGPLLLRCESCLAVFARPAELVELARFEIPEEEVAKEKPSWLLQLMKLARRALGNT